MKNNFKQIEFFALDPNVISNTPTHTLLLGHFTSLIDHGEEIKATLTVSFDPITGEPNVLPTLSNIQSVSEEQAISSGMTRYYHENDVNSAFIYYNFNELLMENKKFELFDNNTFSCEILGLKIDNMEEDSFSYSFSGFVAFQLLLANKHFLKVYYNDLNTNKMLTNSTTHHILGEKISNSLLYKNCFGFGKKLAIQNIDSRVNNANCKKINYHFIDSELEVLDNGKIQIKEKFDNKDKNLRKKYFQSLTNKGFSFSSFFDDHYTNIELSNYCYYLVEKRNTPLNESNFLSKEEMIEHERKSKNIFKESLRKFELYVRNAN